MADFTQNITNTVRVFGEGPSTKWGDANGYPYTMTWGSSYWGEGNKVVVSISKVISNTQSIVDAYSVSAQFNRTIDIGSISGAFEMSTEYLKNGDWYYVFNSNETNADNRDTSTWTAETRPDATFTCFSAGSTTWSEL